MISQTGVCAYFTFASKFSALNGIYQVTQIQSFAAAQAAQVDFTGTTYAQAGLTATDWTADYQSYASDDVYFLTSLDESTKGSVFPVPRGMLDGEPNYEVEKYANLIMTIQLGAWSEPTELKWLMGVFNQNAAAVTGSTTGAILYEDPTSSVWMTKSAYSDMAASRKAQAAGLQPTPYPMQVQQLTTQLKEAQDRVTYYEGLLVALQNGGS